MSLRLPLVLILGLLAVSGPRAQGPVAPDSALFINASLISGDGAGGFTVVPNSVLSVISGKIVSVSARDTRFPSTVGHQPIDLAGKFVIPGIVVAHAHVSDVNGLKPRAYTDENARRQLGVFARYGIT